MTRHLILGNGNMLVCTDRNALIRDFYYPYVGQENHVSGEVHRIGVWVDGTFSWLSRNEWNIEIKYRKESLVSDVKAVHYGLGIELRMTECVHLEKNVYLRNVKIINNSGSKKNIRVFFSQHFNISEDNIGDSISYDPKTSTIINYKGKRYFLIGVRSGGKDFDDYATGISGGIGNRAGTYVDCEDGVLSKNPVEHGSTDSAIGFDLNIDAGKEKEIDYWIAIGMRYDEVCEIRNFVLKNGFGKLMETTTSYWIDWVNTKPIDFYELDEKVIDLFKRSLLIIKAQMDNHGALIAANDTHTLRFKMDTYSYMWPRDGALISRSLDHTGHSNLTKKFFKFCSDVVSKEGYLMHKYNPDGSLGSSWHSWLKGDKIQLPIQEDETALVLDSLWKHYEKYGDEDGMIKDMYKGFIKSMADFMVSFCDPKTGLPKESYDLWEEKLGIHTFTCSAVYAGLISAIKFAEVFGTKKDCDKYLKVAEEVKAAILEYAFDKDRGIFVKGVYYDKDGNLQIDKTIDASTFYGLFEFGLLEPDDERLVKTIDATLKRLWFNDECSGLARYENDNYHRVYGFRENSWFVSTMWLAEYYIKKAKNIEELSLAKNLLDWTTKKALPSGVLSEQLNPADSSTASFAPLTLSHSGFVVAVIKYLRKFGTMKNISE